MEFAPLYPWLYRILKPQFPQCLWQGDPRQPTVALTFDDGPHPDYTPPLLELLARHQVQASFFLLGSLVERSPELVKEMHRQGHWLGIHGYEHRSFPLLSESELKVSLLKTQEAIAQASGLSLHQIQDVRPPNGLFTPRILGQLKRDRYRPVMWSIVPEDWVNPGHDLVLNRIEQQLHNGALIVLHDGYFGGKQVTKITGDLLTLLKQRNLQPLTIQELWQQKTTLTLNTIHKP
jgi:peptidoglycan/xylan/chitin deacetylase (PgdA/CDA1 family)